MVVDETPQYNNDLKHKLHDLVALDKISSIEMISEQIGADEETTREWLSELVEEGSISGTLSEDGARFYSSDLKVSTAPIVAHEELLAKKKSIKSYHAKLLAITGIIMLILGTIVRSLRTIDFRFDNVGIAIYFIGLAIMIVGWILISRANPPEKIR